ncbi:SAM-dependent methyltransferase, partial [Thauera sp. UPWRP]
MNALDHALQPLAGLRLARLPRATRLCLEMLDRLDGGAIAVELPDGVRVRAGHGALVAHLRVRDHAVFDEALARGDIGFGEAWMDGLWDTEDLPGLLRLLSANRSRLQGAI